MEKPWTNRMTTFLRTTTVSKPTGIVLLFGKCGHRNVLINSLLHFVTLLLSPLESCPWLITEEILACFFFYNCLWFLFFFLFSQLCFKFLTFFILWFVFFHGLSFNFSLFNLFILFWIFNFRLLYLFKV